MNITAVRVEAMVERSICWRSFPGSVIHGALGHQLKRASCVVRQSNCSECYLVHDCTYGQLFVSPVPDDAERMRKYPQTPHPIHLVVIPWTRPRLLSDERLTIDLTLFGPLGRHLLKILLALEEALSVGVGRAENGVHRGTARIVAVMDRITQHRHDWAELQRSYRAPAAITPLSSAVAAGSSHDVELRFRTPVRLKTRGKMNFQPTVFDLASNLRRRLENLEYFFGCSDGDDGYKDALDAAESIEAKVSLKKAPAVRYSARQRRTVAISGLVGLVHIPSCPAILARLFEQGRYTGLGKGTSMGLGSFDTISQP